MLSVMHRYWKILLSCFFLTALSAASFADGAVTDLKVVEGANTVKIEIVSNGPVQHRAKSITQPGKAVVIDIFPAKLGANVKALYTVNKGLVSNVRVKQYTDNTVRVTVEAVSLPEYQIVTSGSQGLTVAVSTSTMAEGKATTTPVEVAAAPKTTVAPKVQPKTPKAQPQPEPSEPIKVLTNRDLKPAKHGHQMQGVPNTAAFQGQGESISALRARVAPRRSRPRSKMVSLDFVNADLVYVIKVLAKEMNKNVYVGPGVEGSVTVTLKSVPVEGALALILKMQENEFDYKVVEPNTIIVAPKEKLGTIPDDILQKGPVGPQIPRDSIEQEIQLEKAPAAKIISFLETRYKNVKFTAHPSMNGFYAKGSRKDVLQIKSEIGSLDRVPEAPAKPEREFIRVNYGDLNEVKSLLATLVPDVQYNVDARRNTLILEGSPSAIEQVKELLDQLDRPNDMVMIDVKVVDLSESGSKALGITWGSASGPGTLATVFQEGGVGQSVQRVNNSGAAAQGTTVTLDPLTVPATPAQVGFGIQAFSRSPFAITANLQFLVTQGEAKIMASPRVGTIAGKPALIHIGDKFPIVYFDPRAGQFQVQYVDIGIKLDVKADIKADGNVEMDLNPEVSTLVGLVNNQYPRTTVRRVQTIMRVKDGDTIVLGGLITEQDISSVQKIPFLGDLPIIGSMFRNLTQTRSRNEVVLMVTPHVMR